MNELATLAVGAVITVLLLTTGHWMPWRLSRILAYVYGTVSLWIGFTIWRVSQGDVKTPLGFLILAIIGGVTVKLAYTADGVTREVREARMRRSVDDTPER